MHKDYTNYILFYMNKGRNRHSVRTKVIKYIYVTNYINLYELY